MSNKPLGVALVGYGVAGEVFHSPLLKTTEGLEVTVITTSNAERKKKRRRKPFLTQPLQIHLRMPSNRTRINLTW